MIRGAELYDLFMMVRHERDMAKARGLWTLVCAMAAEWKRQDDLERDGRPSWRNVDDATRDKVKYMVKRTNIRAGR